MKLGYTVFLGVVLLAALAAPLAAEAQPAGKLPRIGILSGGAPGSGGPLPVLLDALRDVGLAEGRSAVFDIRYTEGRTERFPAFAAELVSLRVDVLVAASTPGAIAAKQATSTIPVVMVAVSDPVGSKLVASLARPGGNITGLSLLAPELSAKRLDLLKQALPRASRVAVLWNVSNEGMMLRFRETQTAARTLGVSIESVGVRTPEDFEDAFTRMTTGRPDALLVLADTVTQGQRKRIVQFADAKRIPAIYEVRSFVDAGGLMAYGIDLSDQYRQVAIYVDKILKGANPADLPVEQPSKFELVINLKTARALNLTIPVPLLMRADQVIE
ncbi:MAG: ABC transporter substrate-binding protein [Candidatus Rokuibacteriota bacterium]